MPPTIPAGDGRGEAALAPRLPAGVREASRAQGPGESPVSNYTSGSGRWRSTTYRPAAARAWFCQLRGTNRPQNNGGIGPCHRTRRKALQPSEIAYSEAWAELGRR